MEAGLFRWIPTRQSRRTAERSTGPTRRFAEPKAFRVAENADTTLQGGLARSALERSARSDESSLLERNSPEGLMSSLTFLLVAVHDLGEPRIRGPGRHH